MKNLSSVEAVRKYYVYMHQNQLNNKRYFGITCQKPTYRWRRGNSYKSNLHFYNAIQKYGWDNFTHQILAENLTESEAKQLEQKLIAEFNTTDPTLGYNKTIGGEGNLKYSLESDRYKALREQKNKAQRKLRQEEAFKERERQYSKQYRLNHKDNQSLAMNSPEKRKQYMATYLADPDHFEKRRLYNNEISRQQFKEVSELRLTLKKLFETNPACFSTEQAMLAFGRKGRNYITTSKKLLKDILDLVLTKLKETEEEDI